MIHQKAVARTNIGNVLRAAYAAHPDHPETARWLVGYLYNSDALEELIHELAPSLSHSEADPECLHFVGIAALVLGDNVLAERTLARAVSWGHRESMGHWVKALFALGKTAEAYEAGMRTLEEFPNDDAAGQVIFGMLLDERRYAELWDLCSRLCTAGGWNSRIVSAMALAAQTEDQIALVHRITDRDTWLEQLTFGSDQRNELSHQLKESILWGPLPRAKATVGGGKRIEKIHTLHDPSLEAFFEHIQAVIANYIEKRADLFGVLASDQPMTAMRPEHLALTSWALAVSMEGHEGWHIHPDGWLSGVLYLEVPDLSASDAPHAGQIEFGPYPLGPAANDAAWPGWKLQPRTGDLILFPSYFAHRTWPTGVTQDRICIAFDVLRRGIDKPPAIDETDSAATNIGSDDQLVRYGRAVCAGDDAGLQIVMNVDTGKYLVTDEIGALVWNLLQEPHTTSELSGTLQREFNGVEAEIAKDIANVLGVMVSCGVVEIV